MELVASTTLLPESTPRQRCSESSSLLTATVWIEGATARTCRCAIRPRLQVAAQPVRVLERKQNAMVPVRGVRQVVAFLKNPLFHTAISLIARTSVHICVGRREAGESPNTAVSVAKWSSGGFVSPMGAHSSQFAFPISPQCGSGSPESSSLLLCPRPGPRPRLVSQLSISSTRVGADKWNIAPWPVFGTTRLVTSQAQLLFQKSISFVLKSGSPNGLPGPGTTASCSGNTSSTGVAPT